MRACPNATGQQVKVVISEGTVAASPRERTLRSTRSDRAAVDQIADEP